MNGDTGPCIDCIFNIIFSEQKKTILFGRFIEKKFNNLFGLATSNNVITALDEQFSIII